MNDMERINEAYAYLKRCYDRYNNMLDDDPGPLAIAVAEALIVIMEERGPCGI